MTDTKARMRKATESRLGFDGYCSILAGIVSRPGTTEEIALRNKVNKNTMSYVLRSLYRMRLIHRSAWVRPKAHSVEVPVWRFGEAGDTQPDVSLNRHCTRPARMSAITIAAIRDCLEHGPASMHELANDMGIHRETCTRLVRILRSHGLIRIAEWRQREGANGGEKIPCYAFGKGGSAPKPEPLGRTPEQARKHSADFYQRQKQMRLMRVIAGATA